MSEAAIKTSLLLITARHLAVYEGAEQLAVYELGEDSELGAEDLERLRLASRETL